MSCHNTVRMRQFDAHHRAIYIATSRDDHLPQSILISKVNPRISDTGKWKHTKCNSTDPRRVDDDGGSEPFGYLYKLRCGVYTPMLYGYAAVSHTKALLLYILRYWRTKATNYTAVFITNALRPTLRCLRANVLLHVLTCLTPKH